MATQVQTNPLGIRDSVVRDSLREQQVERLQRIEAASFPYVREKLVNDGKYDAAELDIIEVEFKRFLGLVALGIKPLGMISREVDDFWHQFILFTRLYAKFCDEVMGFFVHHMPRTSYTPIARNGSRSFIEAYEKHFGTLPDLWDRNREAECPDSTPSGWCGDD